MATRLGRTSAGFGSVGGLAAAVAATLNATRFESPLGSATNTQLFSQSINSVDDRYYLAWSGSYDFQRGDADNGMQLFWAIQNLLDKDAPASGKR
jgi:hypothetical protein